MKVQRVTARRVRVPLKAAFRTAELERTESDSVVVEVTLEDGASGFGEGVPRSYVTGETPETCIEFLRAEAPALVGRGTTSFAETVAIASNLGFGPDPGKPRCAARAALELALLDAAGRHFAVSLSSLASSIPEFASIACRREDVRYGVVLSLGAGAFKSWLYRLYGFRDAKLKLGTDPARDLARVAHVRRALGKHVDLRVDANGAWTPSVAAAMLPQLGKLGVSFVEQPVARSDAVAFAPMRPAGSPPVILDESLLGERDAQFAVEEKLGDAFNLRVSKNGGMIPLMRLAKFALERRIGIVLGCHPGETGILSAAGRAIACSVRNFLFLEGSYDRHILAGNVIDEDVTFGPGGHARRLSGPGLGVTVRRDYLDAMTIETFEVA